MKTKHRDQENPEEGTPEDEDGVRFNEPGSANNNQGVEAQYYSTSLVMEPEYQDHTEVDKDYQNTENVTAEGPAVRYSMDYNHPQYDYPNNQDSPLYMDPGNEDQERL